MTTDDQRARYERARRPGEQRERRQQIHDAVRGLIADGAAPHDLTVAGIARASSLAPASLYTYYRGKDAVLLAVLGEDLDRWLGGLAEQLDRHERPSTDEVADLVVSSAVGEPTLAPLLVALSAGVEVGAASDDLAAFKRRGGEHVANVAAALERALPGVDGEAAMRYLRALIIGLWSYATPADPSRAPAQARKSAQRWFEQELRRSIAALFRGLAT